MKKALSTEQTPENIEAVKTILSQTHGKLQRLIAHAGKEKLNQPLGAGERTIIEVLAHMLHCEARSSEAIYLALLADEPLIVDLHPEREYGRLLRYDLLEIEDLLGYFEVRRKLLLRVLAEVPEKKWSRNVREAGKHRKESVYWSARTIALHELDHLEDLALKLKA
jgi:hypothetical protein